MADEEETPKPKKAKAAPKKPRAKKVKAAPAEAPPAPKPDPVLDSTQGRKDRQEKAASATPAAADPGSTEARKARSPQ